MKFSCLVFFTHAHVLCSRDSIFGVVTRKFPVLSCLSLSFSHFPHPKITTRYRSASLPRNYENQKSHKCNCNNNTLLTLSASKCRCSCRWVSKSKSTIQCKSCCWECCGCFLLCVKKLQRNLKNWFEFSAAEKVSMKKLFACFFIGTFIAFYDLMLSTWDTRRLFYSSKKSMIEKFFCVNEILGFQNIVNNQSFELNLFKIVLNAMFHC